MELEKALVRNPELEVTLINRENFSLFTPMLHEVTASDLDLTAIVNPLRKMLSRAKFFEGEVKAIDLPRKQVIVFHGFDEHQHSIPYHQLVIGLGSVTNLYELPGLDERTLTMKSLGDDRGSGLDPGPAVFEGHRAVFSRIEESVRLLFDARTGPSRRIQHKQAAIN